MGNRRIPGTLPLGFDSLDRWYRKSPRGRSGTAGADRRGTVDDRPAQIGIDGLHSVPRNRLWLGSHESRYGQPVQLRSTKLAQVAPDVAVDWLSPHALGRPTVAQRRHVFDPLIDGGGQAGDESALAIADEPHEFRRLRLTV